MISRLLMAGMTLAFATSANAQAHTAPSVQLDKFIPVSQVSGVDIVRLTELPKAPKKNEETESCVNRASKTPSAEARAVEEHGWTLTGEAKLGSLQVVSFVADTEEGTSGSCLLKDGNIAFYDDGKLVALAYASKKTALSLGRVEEHGDVLRLWDGDLVQQPVADVKLVGGKGIVITALPNEEKFCAGQVTVPNVRHVPIILARMMLKEYGWQPEQSKQEPDSTSQDLLDMGINEVDGCAGTGFGFCGFEYKNAGNSLSVATVGDSPDTPSVISYDVKCSN
ncbi:hypothetical protein J3U99_15655 [Brucella pituitosa]|uniref:hypothetical protein n=1 Tax=Brucella pituitosa TaxID=571256 RepID=UPI000C273F17|nr:hypothetical protein [Brucella pituitosa]MCK4206213.1 hypothetical protein [Brucella pituitosa]PJO46133.1 hypothetical protein CWE02_13205 [Brucella pituitosa]PRA85128.1 hypothetical protein CQ054_13270 [Ochrobactrum sp. MYb29]